MSQAVAMQFPFGVIVPLVSRYLQLENFLSPHEQSQLLDYVLQQEAAFVPATTSITDATYRQAWVLYTFPQIASWMGDRIQAAIPEVLKQLNLPSFSIAQLEMQITAHNDGHYFKIHNDNGSAAVANRELSYVYYFYREPKAFSGGELQIYDSYIDNHFYVAAESSQIIEPRNNSIVFFLSRYLHEVLPICCPTRTFANSRFTVNGWVRR